MTRAEHYAQLRAWIAEEKAKGPESYALWMEKRKRRKMAKARLDWSMKTGWQFVTAYNSLNGCILQRPNYWINPNVKVKM